MAAKQGEPLQFMTTCFRDKSRRFTNENTVTQHSHWGLPVYFNSCHLTGMCVPWLLRLMILSVPCVYHHPRWRLEMHQQPTQPFAAAGLQEARLYPCRGLLSCYVLGPTLYSCTLACCQLDALCWSPVYCAHLRGRLCSHREHADSQGPLKVPLGLDHALSHWHELTCS